MGLLKMVKLSALVLCALVINNVQAETFNNPLLSYNSPDPFVIYHEVDGFYYMVLSDFTKMTVLKSSVLTDWRDAETQLIYTLEPGWFNLWAPELHFLSGQFYIYFTMEDGDHANHRMYAIKSDTPGNPMGTWSQTPVKIAPAEEDYFAIDGTVFHNVAGDGELYFIYSGWENSTFSGPLENYKQSLYIAKMSSPLNITGRRALIREPGRTWEWHPNWGTLNEGPEMLIQANRTFLVYSASSTWTPEYCLGYVVLEQGQDPMVRSNWVQITDGCVFYRNDPEGVWGPGHASFTVSKDGRETWMVYHALDDITNPGTNRTARAERILWNRDSTPVFPRPAGFLTQLEVPSGQ